MNEASQTEKTDYQKTLNLPQTDFSMKADLTKKEPIIRGQWAKLDLYHEILKKNHGRPKYILHDGPPYANGNVHIGTALNKILKDIVVKFKTMQGFYSPYIPGWDCHGLPIEHKVLNELGPKAKTVSQSQIRQECETYARKFIDIQRKQFRALGIFGDWDNPYLTLNPSYEAGVIEVFRDLVKSGYIYRKLRPIHWCMHCETVLAEAELEYSNETSPSIYVKFPLTDAQTKELTSKVSHSLGAVSSSSSLDISHSIVSFFIWTTTPWTLPANVAVALNPAFEYALVQTGSDVLIMAAGLVEKVMALIGVTDYKILGKVKGATLEGLAYNHPFVQRTCQVILADYVSLEDGTGIVHIAPGHGIEDYESGLKYKLPVISPVDKAGRFTPEAGVFLGERVFDADPKICQMLTDQKLLLNKVDVVHSYPHCWRCKKPLIFRATEQWFISVDNHSARQKAIEEVKKARWVPEWGKNRTVSMLESRPDWCVSRQRNWGVPIPIFYCAKCNQSLLDVKVIDHVRGIFAKEGANAWFIKSAAELMPAGVKCKCGSTEFNKENDIFDVWFESGSSFRSVVIENKDLQFPADLYLEGSDQPARWFQLSLLPSVMTRGVAPFKNVLIHGFVKRPEGEKLSKSKGAMTSDEMVAKVGADILRLWISSINFTEDIPISLEILQEKADPYRKVRNTFRYMLGNLYDYNPDTDAVKYAQMLEIDRWALNKLHRLIDMTTQSYANFEFYKVFREVYEFCVVEMSSFYFDILKDRLYTFGAKSIERRSAQTSLNEILQSLVKLVAPILSYSAEEIWDNILFVNAGRKTPDAKLPRSVHLLDWPKVDPTKIDNKLDENWKKIFLIRSEVTKEIETLRKAGQIGSSIEADVTLYTDGADLLEFLMIYEKELATIHKVSSVKVIKKPAQKAADQMQMGVAIAKSGNQKCARCWNSTADVGKTTAHPTLCGRCIGVISG
ncbi:MAG: isoleucine--tRNA ligase [Planctomycetes bacterium]|nr:isoleucine--tRNA ligase [Planctomycetota bacterium]